MWRERTSLDRERRFAVGALTAVLGIGLAAVPQACTKRLPHGGEDPVYPLRGLHAAVPCEGCHGAGTPKAQSTVCIDCHEADVPDPGHYPGQNCSPCHTEFGWDQIATTLVPPETGTAPTGDTGPTTTPYDPHAGLTTDLLCWTCHEVDRPATPTPNSPTHYAHETLSRRFDCGPCHGLKDWLGESPSGLGAPYEHVTRSPHGTYSDNVENPQNEWVVGCDQCHTTPGNYTTFDCQTCHLDLILTPPGHFGVSEPTPANNESCVVCHPTGDYP